MGLVPSSPNRSPNNPNSTPPPPAQRPPSGNCPSNNYPPYSNPRCYPYPPAYVPHGNLAYNAGDNVNIGPRAQKNPDVKVGNQSQKLGGLKIGSIGRNIRCRGVQQHDVKVGNIGYQGGEPRSVTRVVNNAITKLFIEVANNVMSQLTRLFTRVGKIGHQGGQQGGVRVGDISYEGDGQPVRIGNIGSNIGKQGGQQVVRDVKVGDIG